MIRELHCVENPENCAISKQKLLELSNDTFGTYQQFKIIFTGLMKSPQRRKASVEVKNSVF